MSMNLQALRTEIAGQAVKLRAALAEGPMTRDDLVRRYLGRGLPYRDLAAIVDRAIDGIAMPRHQTAQPAESTHREPAIGAPDSALAVLVPVERISLDGGLVPTVDARKLHAWLGVRRDFSTWARERIATYGLAENVDFVRADFSPDPGKNARGRPGLDIHLTLDAAKQLSMVDGGPRGAEVRRYFLACERAARASMPEQVAGAGLGTDPARTIGGVVKGVVARQVAEAEGRIVANTEVIVRAELLAMEERLRAALRSRQVQGSEPGAGADQQVPVPAQLSGTLTGLDLVELVVPAAANRRSLAMIASSGLRHLTRARGEAPTIGRGGTLRFAAGIAQEWLRGGGCARLQEAAR